MTEATSNSLEKVVKRLKRESSLGLRFPTLDMETVDICVYSDASFASNRDYKWQIGFFAVRADDTQRCNIIHWSSTKCGQVTPLVLGAELHAFSDALDFG